MGKQVKESSESLPSTIPKDVARQLGHYVYIYIDPRTGNPFYVGKGVRQRALAHLSSEVEDQKRKILQELQAAGVKARIDILAHGLPDKETALRVEAAVIDLFNLDKLTNRTRGWRSIELGRWPLADLVAHYAAKPVEIDDPVMLIRINKLYRPGMPPSELYEATRRAWRARGSRRDTSRFACAVFEGVVREVYEISQWRKASPREGESWKGERWEFDGKIADGSVRSKYLGRRVESYFPRGSQNPVTYVNCDEARRPAVGVQAATVDDPVMLIRIKKLYRPGMSPDELYEATRRAWRAGKRREMARFACAVFEGVVREVYEIGQWREASPDKGDKWKKGERWEFVGKLADKSVRSKYLGHPVKFYFTRGARNPIAYVNC